MNPATPKSTRPRCSAVLFIAYLRLQCQQKDGHKAPHRYKGAFGRYNPNEPQRAEINWDG